MRTVAMFLAATTLFASQAGAVVVTGIATSGDNSVNVVTQEPNLLEVDFALYSGKPIALDLAASDIDETSFEMNSVVDVFTGLSLGKNLRALTLRLEGVDDPTFEVVGDIAPAFVGYSFELNDARDRLVIRLDRPGEPFAVLLGAFEDGQTNFAISWGERTAVDPSDVGTARLILNGTVPEPAAWALMIAGFGLVGAAARRRRSALPTA